ncbi:unnamed protein product [Caenorhabditis angaria]|uniref:Uncharacterized protein n=1 Tax=Caenorhabditis angaria TaxID=860376 RepID=A0A9P1IRW2_9PELO|nr:unnamed protein product [Caenorhabditis angaria]
MDTIRYHKEINGIKSYFFSPLLRYIFINEQKLIENKKVNQFAAFILGLTDNFPTADDFERILTRANPNNYELITEIDRFLLFGNDYLEITQILVEKLTANGINHDVYTCRFNAKDSAGFKEDFEKLVRKSVIGKVKGSQFLRSLQSIMMAESGCARFAAISDLCIHDFDWDAYVYLKLFFSEKEEEIKLIRDRIIEKIKGKHDGLVDIWEKAELARSLKKSMAEIIEKVLPTIIEQILPIVERENEYALIQLAGLTSQIFYFFVRAILDGELDLVEDIYKKIPESIRRLMFPGLIRSIVKPSITFVTYFSQFFISIPGNPLKLAEIEVELFKMLDKPWKRDALLKIVYDFKAAISRNPFGCAVFLGGHERSQILLAFDFVSEAVLNFGGEFDFLWMHFNVKSMIIKKMKGETASTAAAKEYLAKLVRGLEKKPFPPCDPSLFISKFENNEKALPGIDDAPLHFPNNNLPAKIIPPNASLQKRDPRIPKPKNYHPCVMKMVAGNKFGPPGGFQKTGTFERFGKIPKKKEKTGSDEISAAGSKAAT